MIHQIFENIVNQENVRQNLSKLRQALKDGTNKHALLYCIGSRHQVLIDLLESSDSKTRKNAALLMGDLGVEVYLQPLFEAYEKEETLFVRSAYLTALKEYDYRPYLGKLKEQLSALTAKEIPEESKKHILEEIRLLNELVIMMEGIQPHKFVGYEETSQLVLLTNRNHKNITFEQLDGMPAKSFNAGVFVKCKNLNDILKIRTYQEMRFMVGGILTCPAKAAEAEGSKQDYTSIGDAFNDGMSTFDTFQDGWASDAFDAGASWGDGVADSVSNMFSGGGAGDIDLTGGIDPSFLDSSNFAQNAGNGIADTADNTGKIADSVDISSENLKYLRDIAETEAINRFTTAEIQVTMNNNNNVSSDTDIDGMVDSLSAGVLEAMEQAAEGVH